MNVDAYLDRIERLNPRINASITVTAERAREDARRATEEFAAGKLRGIDLGGVHLDVQHHGLLGEGRQPLGHDVDEQDGEEQRRQGQGRRAIEAEATLGSVALLDQFVPDLSHTVPDISARCAVRCS
jgi:hypothetical protein